MKIKLKQSTKKYLYSLAKLALATIWEDVKPELDNLFNPAPRKKIKARVLKGAQK